MESPRKDSITHRDILCALYENMKASYFLALSAIAIAILSIAFSFEIWSTNWFFIIIIAFSILVIGFNWSRRLDMINTEQNGQEELKKEETFEEKILRKINALENDQKKFFKAGIGISIIGIGVTLSGIGVAFAYANSLYYLLYVLIGIVTMLVGYRLFNRYCPNWKENWI